ncbi:MAG: hypothetical protein ACFFDP_10935 [Promethearchaeota archaeon]
MTTELYALKIRRYLREARKRRNQKDFYAAGIFYKRAARTAYQAKKSAKRYESMAIACFEKQVEDSLAIDKFSQAADAIEHIAKIREQNGDTQTAADLRLQASYLRLKGIETLIA